MDTAESAPSLPDRWWEDIESILVSLVHDDRFILISDPNASREQIAQATAEEVCEMHRINGLLVVPPDPGTPEYGAAIRAVVPRLNKFIGRSARLRVVDADQGRVQSKSGPAATLRLLVVVGDAMPPMELVRRPGRLPDHAREADNNRPLLPLLGYQLRALVSGARS